MADHVRKQIRDAVKTALTVPALVTVPAANVFKSRVYHAEKTKMPALLVYTLRERSSRDGIRRPRPLSREVEVSVEAIARANTAADDQLDQIAKEVEAVLGNNLLGGLVKDLWLAATETAFSGQGEKKIMSARMTWVAVYRTNETDATVTA